MAPAPRVVSSEKITLRPRQARCLHQLRQSASKAVAKRDDRANGYRAENETLAYADYLSSATPISLVQEIAGLAVTRFVRGKSQLRMGPCPITAPEFQLAALLRLHCEQR